MSTLLNALQYEKSYPVPIREQDTQQMTPVCSTFIPPLFEGAGIVEWSREDHTTTRWSNCEEVRLTIEFLKTYT